jgi:hypothetical protein
MYAPAMKIEVGQTVTYKNRPEGDPQTRGVVIRWEGVNLGERTWLVAWEHPTLGEQRLKTPETLIRPVD